MRSNSNKATVIILLTMFFLVQLSSIHPIVALTSETTKLQPASEVTVSNLDGVTNGSIVGKLSGVSWITYMTFDLSSIPKDATIQSIKLKVYSSVITTGNKFVNVHSTSSDWTENTIGWNNRPADDKLLGTQWIELFYEWYTWDFTNWGVETQNNKLSISLELSIGMDGYLEFYSKDTPSAPYLEITYTLPDPTPTPTIYQPIDYIVSFIVFGAILAVIGIVGFIAFRKIFPKKPQYLPPPPPPPNSWLKPYDPPNDHTLLFNASMK